MYSLKELCDFIPWNTKEKVLKNVHVCIYIYENNTVGDHGQKHSDTDIIKIVFKTDTLGLLKSYSIFI